MCSFVLRYIAFTLFIFNFIAEPNVGVPMSEMNDSYTKESATLSEAIIKYGTLDLYDPQRVQVINVSIYTMPTLS